MVDQNKKAIHFRNQRKKAVASCRIKLKDSSSPSELKIVVNQKPFTDYFFSLQTKMARLLEIQGYAEKVEIFFVKVTGGGISGQFDAAISAMAKAIVDLDASLKKALKDKRLYKHDPRQHERHKPGLVKRRKLYPYRKR
jgi:small subunit ribosomal protein S9